MNATSKNPFHNKASLPDIDLAKIVVALAMFTSNVGAVLILLASIHVAVHIQPFWNFFQYITSFLVGIFGSWVVLHPRGSK